MEKEITVFEANYGHTRRERERKSHSGRRQILQRAVDDADIWPPGLVLIERCVDQGRSVGHVGILLHTASESVGLLRPFSARPLIRAERKSGAPD